MACLDIAGQEIGRERLFLIGGPCVIESEELVFSVARSLREICRDLSIPFVLKSSYDKANRTSIASYRGPGIDEGLAILAAIRERLGVPVLTDVHSVDEARTAARVVDVLQVPAFLARQTDLLRAVGESGKTVNLKKAQFMAPWDMAQAVAKVRSTGNERILLTERGTQFGYNNLVVDMRSMAILGELGHPVIFDATHSVQLPGGQGTCSGGQRRFVDPLACAAVAAGAHGVFLEIHEDPDSALCDGPNSLPLVAVRPLLEKLLRIHRAVRNQG